MSKTILVTDDERHMLKILEFSLMDTGCHIETATSGAEAIRKASDTTIDLLLIDINLAGGASGIETMRTLRAQPAYEKLPVIVMTGGGSEDFNSEAQAAGAAVFLTKPFSPSELSRHVKRLLEL